MENAIPSNNAENNTGSMENTIPSNGENNTNSMENTASSNAENKTQAAENTTQADTQNNSEKKTKENSQQKINSCILSNVADAAHMSTKEIEEHIKKLDVEWDIDKYREASDATVILLSTVLGYKVCKKWFLLSALTACCMLQHATLNWSPSMPILRKMGIRTKDEILREKKYFTKILNNNDNENK